MSGKGRQRRRRDDATPLPDATPLHDDVDPAARVVSLIDEAVAAIQAGPRSGSRFEAAVDALVDLDGFEGPGVYRPERTLGDRLRSSVAALWERGWEPVELDHMARREPDSRLPRLLAAAMLAELVASDRLPLLPPRWRDQLAALGIEVGAAPSTPPSASVEGFVVTWRGAERLDVGTSIECAVTLWVALANLPALDPLGDPPSRWTLAAAPGGPGPEATPGPETRPGPPADPKLLTTIRALLAKAESTSFPAEAEAFAAKAQSLMSRHAIDAAVVAAASPHLPGGEVRLRRIPIDDPYATEKAGLLHVVADVNDVQAVWDDRVGLATIIGFPSDLDVVELLFTSLLVQATRAVNDPANASPERRAPSFRRAFILAYADRIGDRLQRARDAAGRDAALDHGAGLVPILAARRATVEAVADELYPRTRAGHSRMVDARGWEAGRAAADRARLRP